MIILNEKTFAEECLKNGIANDKPFLTISILARYFCHAKGQTKKQIIDSLISYLDEHYPQYRYSKEYWLENIEKVAGRAKKYPLHEIDGVAITEAELETIAGLHDKVLERLAFTNLCLAKLNILRNPANGGWVNNNDRDVFKLARISATHIERQIKIGRLIKMGLFKDSNRIDNLSYRVTFIDDDSPTRLIIRDFRELGYEYMLYKGGNFFRCRECGILARNNKNRTKVYCSTCVADEPMGTKWLICTDCGDKFEVDSRNNKTKRCPYCQRIKATDYKKARNKRYYERIKTLANSG